MKDFILQHYRISFSNSKSLLYFTTKNPKNIKVGQYAETNTHFYLHEVCYEKNHEGCFQIIYANTISNELKLGSINPNSIIFYYFIDGFNDVVNSLENENIIN